MNAPVVAKIGRSIVAASAVATLTRGGAIDSLQVIVLVLVNTILRYARFVRFDRKSEHVREHMVNAIEKNKGVQEDADGRDAADSPLNDLPSTKDITHFAISVTGGDSSPVVKNLVPGAEKFKFQGDDYSESSARWIGPPSSSILRTTDISIFVTTDGQGAPEEGGASLFIARGTSHIDDAASEKRMQIGITDGSSGLATLYAEFGTDRVEVPYPRSTTIRTHYMTRRAGRVKVGYFEPFTKLADESTYADAKDSIRNENAQAVLANAQKDNVGKILSIIVYKSDMGDDIQRVRTGISTYVFKNFPAYRTLNASKQELEVKMREKVETPPFSGEGVIRHCASVADWSLFNPATTSSACRAAIKDSCEKKPSQPGCECWDENSAAFRTEECATLRSLYDGVRKPELPGAGPTPEPSGIKYAQPPTIMEYILPL